MKDKPAAIFFDKNDYQLLEIVNDIRERGAQSHTFRSLLVEYLHPQGIKEMAAARGLRIAYAVAGLLDSLESGKAKDRIIALRSLHDEVLLSVLDFLPEKYRSGHTADHEGVAAQQGQRTPLPETGPRVSHGPRRQSKKGAGGARQISSPGDA